MKLSTRVFALIVLLPSMALFFAIGALSSGRSQPVQAAGTRTFTFVNNTSQTVWAGALGNAGQVAPGNGGWTMTPG
ncbi:MAG TPA: hypothetical protein VKR06_28355, partial [Ktedonosporobacter sp.]|nr:hypothetical protein [Ktedonosporobacter sp.]